MIRAGLVSNALSQQNKKGMAAVSAAAEQAGLEHRVLPGVEGLDVALDHFAKREIALLAVNGGDGTVQAVLTELLERRPFAQPPALALLRGGTTNMTAADIGLRGRPHRAIGRLAALLAGGELGPHLHRRPVLRLENVPGHPVQCGMFFGAGGITQAIDYCHAKVHALGIEADWASGLTLLRLLAGQLFRGERSRVVTGHRMTLSFDGGADSTEARLLVLATTLDRLVLGSRPYWNQGGGPVRFTAVAYPPKRLLRAVPRVLYGGPGRSLPGEGYVSRGAARVELRMDCRFTLDGQMFDSPGADPLAISAPDSIEFLRC